MTKSALRFALAALILTGCVSQADNDANHPVAAADPSGERCHTEQVTGSMMMRRVCEPTQRSQDDHDQQIRDLQMHNQFRDVNPNVKPNAQGSYVVGGRAN